MKLVHRVRRFSAMVAASAVLAVAAPAFAQDISDAHLKAARDAVAAIRATDFYDGILPQAAAALKGQMIDKNPDLQEVITSTVDDTALKLAGRRADLEKEAALAYARVFSEEDLKAIAAFYNSPAGKKLLQDGPIVTREAAKAADIWQRGIARDLAEQAATTLEATLKEKGLIPKPGATDAAEPAPQGEAAPAN
ncbi:DUF2059 domain-containing protein [Pseudaminobacter soli (ex Li et al. 2025)]|uniref:DUF2059 domain-containing protein n=1 Tax=Pseudaminobacter soli (ex Li et al. 2025) TaxID=1295366 RepID=A0A2P7SN64_9HYPH|nr:DUF2059 domain-containing protein [Mesorhizobium soli]PSJ63934.1 hypothetical protein C7I85_02110 [Mesorhizobium soli]